MKQRDKWKLLRTDVRSLLLLLSSGGLFFSPLASSLLLDSTLLLLFYLLKHLLHVHEARRQHVRVLQLWHANCSVVQWVTDCQPGWGGFNFYIVQFLWTEGCQLSSFPALRSTEQGTLHQPCLVKTTYLQKHTFHKQEREAAEFFTLIYKNSNWKYDFFTGKWWHVDYWLLYRRMSCGHATLWLYISRLSSGTIPWLLALRDEKSRWVASRQTFRNTEGST